MSHANRSRLQLAPVAGLWSYMADTVPSSMEALAVLFDGDSTAFPAGVLVRVKQTGILCKFSSGARSSVDERKAQAAHEQMEAAPVGGGDERHELAALVKTWRGSMTAKRAGKLLGISGRTVENIEQGRGFAHGRLLILAIMAFGPATAVDEAPDEAPTPGG